MENVPGFASLSLLDFPPPLPKAAYLLHLGVTAFGIQEAAAGSNFSWAFTMASQGVGLIPSFGCHSNGTFTALSCGLSH